MFLCSISSYLAFRRVQYFPTFGLKTNLFKKKENLRFWPKKRNIGHFLTFKYFSICLAFWGGGTVCDHCAIFISTLRTNDKNKKEWKSMFLPPPLQDQTLGPSRFLKYFSICLKFLCEITVPTFSRLQIFNLKIKGFSGYTIVQ